MEDITSIVKLRDLVPICSHCKSVRKDKAYWDSIENYLDPHLGAELSHSICPECANKHFPDLNIYDD